MDNYCNFPDKVRAAIAARSLLSPGGHVLVALSGGADSVALLLALLSSGFRVEAAHCNFHLRGKESDRDERFVRQLCRERGIGLHLRHFDTLKAARDGGISIEMAARQLRYAFFDELLRTTGAEAVAVAHHRDDNNETLLLNLARGTGLRGLTGMAWRTGNVVRPMLDLTRRDAEAYLEREGQGYVTDSTNLKTVFKRNRIRHEVMPLLRRLNPSADEAIAATMRRLSEAEALYLFAVETLKRDVAKPRGGGIEIDIAKLKGCPAPATLLHEMLSPYGFPPATIAEMARELDGRPGAVYEGGGYVATRDRGRLIAQRRPARVKGIALPGEGCIDLPDGSRLRLSLREGATICRERSVACLDADKLRGGLICRSLRTADRFVPYGMEGSKLASDYLTDRKRTRIEKMAALAVCDGEGIAWIVDERPAARCAVGRETRRTMFIEHLPATTPE